jgi:hypothetical protein
MTTTVTMHLDFEEANFLSHPDRMLTNGFFALMMVNHALLADEVPFQFAAVLKVPCLLFIFRIKCIKTKGCLDGCYFILLYILLI